MFTKLHCHNPAVEATQVGDHFQLRFASLGQPGHSLAFPCDANGRVAMDHMSERSRNNYFLARRVVGRDYAWPVVEPCAPYPARMPLESAAM